MKWINKLNPFDISGESLGKSGSEGIVNPIGIEVKANRLGLGHEAVRIDQIKQTDIGKKILENMKEDEIAELDTDQIMAKQVEELEREKRELMERLKAQDRKLDHMERARRREEIPMLKAAFEVDKEDDKVLWKKQEEERIKQVNYFSSTTQFFFTLMIQQG